jgi:hypothetical protein
MPAEESGIPVSENGVYPAPGSPATADRYSTFLQQTEGFPDGRPHEWHRYCQAEALQKRCARLCCGVRTEWLPADGREEA